MKHKQSENQSLPDFWETLDRVKLSIDASDELLAEMMGMRSNHLQRLRSSKVQPLTTHGMNLSKALNLSFNRLMTNQIDYKALRQHHLGVNTYVPERYQLAASSKVRTIHNILNYIEENFGWKQRAHVMKHFQITEEAVENPDREVNLRMAIDMADYLIKQFGSEKVILDMGANSAKLNSKGKVGKILSLSKNILELYAIMFDEIVPNYFESNFVYELQELSLKCCVITGKPNLNVVGVLGCLLYTSPSPRDGLLSRMPSSA